MVGVDELIARRRHFREDAEPAERVLAGELGQDAGGDARPADPVESVTACDHLALDLLVAALVPVADQGSLGLEIVQRDVVHVEVERLGRTPAAAR